MHQSTSNIRAFLTSCLLAGMTLPSFGQVTRDVEPFLVQSRGTFVLKSGQTTGQGSDLSLIDGLGDFCATDVSSLSSRAHMAAYLTARDTDRLTRAAKSALHPPDVGDERSFNVSENNNWQPKNFRLVDKTSRYFLWVDTAELALNRMTDSDIAALRDVTLTQTPAASINPNQGVFLNDEDIYGQPPDYDGDGMVDILMYDIGAGTGGTLGYVSSADVAPGVADGVGNQADVLYLDSNEGTRNIGTLAVIAAHEYTHLLHLSSGWDNTFITEGYAEYAMVMNGYFWRGIDYLNFPAEYVLPLFSWRTSPSNGGPNARDYQRGGLFFTYVADRIGPAGVGRMLQEVDRKGGNALDSLLRLDNRSLEGILKNFHTANFLNDLSIAPEFGYQAVPRQSLHAPLTRRINGETASTTGEPGFNTVVTNDPLNGGAVKYITWDNVSDFQFTLDAQGWDKFPAAIREQIRLQMQSRVQARFMGKLTDGTTEFYDVTASNTEVYRLRESYSSLTLFLLQTDPEVPVGKVKYDANWTPLSQALITATEDDTVLPIEVSLDQNFPNPFSGKTTIGFDLIRASDVRLEIFDLLGRRLLTPVGRRLAAGHHQIILDADKLVSGAYLYRLQTETRSITRRLVIL